MTDFEKFAVKQFETIGGLLKTQEKLFAIIGERLDKVEGRLDKIERGVSVLLAHHGYGPDGEDFRPKVHRLPVEESEEVKA